MKKDITEILNKTFIEYVILLLILIAILIECSAKHGTLYPRGI